METALENTNDGSGSGLFSGETGASVIAGDVNEVKLLLVTDGGSGSEEDTAVVLYNEGSNSESDFANELSLLALFDGVSASALVHDNFYG